MRDEQPSKRLPTEKSKEQPIKREKQTKQSTVEVKSRDKVVAVDLA